MIPKRLETIIESDLQELIDNSVIESKVKEYKQEMNTNTVSEKKEFLADVSSFANTSGGDIYFGIEETDGIPTVLNGLSIDNLDQTKLQIDQIIRNGIEPRIPNLKIQEVPLNNLNHVIIIRIPKSWLAPHRIKFKENHRFYTRGANGKYRMSIDELRTSFNLSETLIDRIRNFRIRSTNNIISAETHIPLHHGAKVLLQLIPIESFDPAHIFDVTKLKEQFSLLTPISGYGNNERFVLDGYIRYHVYPSGLSAGYVIFHRNGIIESFDNRILNTHETEKKIHSIDFERKIIETITNQLNVLNDIGIQTPIFIFLNLVNIRGYDIKFERVVSIDENHQIKDKDVLTLPEIIIDEYEYNVGVVMRNCFDALWNSCNFPCSPNYDEEGNWISKGHFNN